MEIILSVEEYSPVRGVQTGWETGHKISVSIEGTEVVIVVNPEALRTLAVHFLTLAQDGVPTGNHLRYEPGAGLEDGSTSLVIVREG